MGDTTGRALTYLGVVAPATVLITFGLCASLSTTYSWPTDPFSAVGASGGFPASLFGLGLSFGGFLSVGFAIRLWQSGSTPVAVLYALEGLSFAGAGLVPADVHGPVHAVFGFGAFLSIWLLLWTAGVIEWRGGDRTGATVAFLLGSAAVGVWLPYDLGWQWAQIGFGGAELVAVLALAVWSCRRTVRLLDWSGTRSSSGVDGGRSGFSD